MTSAVIAAIGELERSVMNKKMELNSEARNA
jgi:hypothetical protein